MKSVFVINGFLSSGKTQFINYTLAQPYFRTKGTTLLIVCEEGEEDYDERILKATNTVKVNVEEESEISADKLMELEKKFKPSRVIVEYNGMWNYKNFKLPFGWKLEQQITLIDTTTFELYYTNMRSLLAEMMRKSEMIIFNRADDYVDRLASYKRNVKALNQKADIIFEGKEGEFNATLDEELPYDIKADTIELTDETYGAFYIDALDNTDRYKGKKLIFTACAMIPGDYAKGIFVPGRSIMTCCAEDIQFLGFPCRYERAAEIKNHSWVKVTCTVNREYFDGYKAEGPVLTAINVEPAKAPRNEVISFV